MQGVVKSYQAQQGYGYLLDPEGNDVFFHITGIISGSPQQIRVNMPVEFVQAMGKHGFQAAKIRLLGA
ncbi:hypothetical protein B808_1085 [Fructilactobacillus florum 8D]|uniref:CSD domain-containing protein n=2 Tax=Fructilactobacillus florum TaxID=640331 RepID=W9ED33_9LACO|nr:cold shock domain-containing protein [Fructilactobacillus florum]EKK20310.1 hypothetical protein B807_949 [Fructilactobacillus florum 2F]ETO39977.1 hypothetical protein B808_1085 [Fructilactobacillus florum 8D]KRM91655.1 hypothetical protein FC87_GL000792 [Fructilactobacillus florum DSM 22689 = JCM 16035]